MSEVQRIDFYSPEYQTKVKSTLSNMATDINKVTGNGVLVPQTKISEYLDLIQDLIPLSETCAKPKLADLVKEWVLVTEGDFEVTDITRELKLVTPGDIKNLHKILSRLKKENIIAKNGDKRGRYRIVDHSLTPMNWKDADITNHFDITLPLGFSKLFFTYPKNVLVVAGNTNAGKTAWLLNVVRENADKHQINYFTNDETPEEIKKRVQRFSEAGMDVAPFDKADFIERGKNFLDVLNPDGITIIDYLKLTDKFWLVAEEIEAIRERLRKGIAIIAIQKDSNAKMGRGGEFAAEAARLYFTLEKNRINIIKMKNLIDPKKDPNGKCVNFSLWGGCKFVPKGGWKDIPSYNRKTKESQESQERQPGEDDNLDKPLPF